jgi:hypothetical protein
MLKKYGGLHINRPYDIYNNATLPNYTSIYCSPLVPALISHALIWTKPATLAVFSGFSFFAEHSLQCG